MPQGFFWGVRAIGLAAALFATATHAAQPMAPRVLARSGGNFDQRLQDQARCRAISDRAPSEDLPRTGMRAGAGGYAADVPTAVGGAIAFAIIGAIDTSQARGKARAFCLVNLGYVFLPLTPGEATAYSPLTGARREDWERTFLDQDLEPRIAALRAGAIPALPPYHTEPATQGGVRIDLASLTSVQNRVEAGGVVATGKVERWRTAILSAPFTTTDGPVTITGQTGAVFHQVDYRPQRAALLRDQGATWCGPVQQVSVQGPNAPDVYCFTSQADGYDVFRPSGYGWLAGPYRDGFVLPRLSQPILLQEREQDDLGPLDLEIRAALVTSSRVVLEAFAKHDGKATRLWRRQLSFDAAGQAVLPLWSRRMVLTRDEPKGVTVTLDDSGDGHSWRDGDD